MPYRALNPFVAAVGAIAVLAVILLGVNAWRAARTGPRWKRRLLTTGLALLAGLGVVSPGETTAASPAAVAVQQASKLVRSREWKTILSAWKYCKPLAVTRKSTWEQRETADERLKEANEAIDELARTGLLSSGEASLLRQEAANMRDEIYRDPPVGKEVTCYKMVYIPEAKRSFDRLAKQLPALEKIVAAGRIQPSVAEKVLGTIEGDVAVLSLEESLDALKGEERARAEETRDQVKKLVRSIRDLLSSAGLRDSRDWKTVLEAWGFCRPLAANSSQSTTAQRKEADAKMEEAKRAADRLAVAGLLTLAEANLLHEEAATIREAIYRDPPKDCEVTCYEAMYYAPAQQSYERLSKRLPLLEELAARGKISRAVAEKVLATIENDLATLSSDEHLDELKSPQRDEAVETRDKVLAAVTTIKALLAGKEKE